MRILLLSDINSAHTQKWAIALSQKGFQIALFSISLPTVDWYSKFNIYLLSNSNIKVSTITSTVFSKLNYLKLVPSLKNVIKNFKPDIVHAHYASSYGLLGALSGFHPFIISAWGSDVMDFPNKSLAHRMILKYNFKRADRILATSDAIVNAISLLSNKTVHKIPFGIDTDYFKPKKVDTIFSHDCIVVGTVKSLEEIYGIDILIKAFKKVCDKHPDYPLNMLIVGGGSKEQEYKKLVTQLAIKDKVIFTGKVKHSKVVDYHNMIDIFVNVSRNESFGVAVLEASACEKPVIASNIGGLTEVVINGNTGFLVEPENVNATSEAIEKLIANEKLRNEMGANGRIFVQKQFDFNDNINDTLAIYKQLLTNSKD